MPERRIRNRQIKLYLTERERNTLKRKAKKMGMTVSAYIRFAALESANLQITVIDTTPLEKLGYELTKQGVNLNQLMKFLNTYGVDAYNEEEAKRMLSLEGEAFLKVLAALADLKGEAARHNVHILKVNETNDEDVYEQ